MNVVLWFAAAASAAALFVPLSVTWRLAPDLGHAWVVPLLMAYLWWERWHERPSFLVRPQPVATAWIVALALAALHLVLRLFLTPFPLWPAALLAFTLVIVAATLVAAWLLSGRAGVRWMVGPLILLASALPIPSSLENALVIPLRETWAALVAEIINLLGQPALALGTSIRIGSAWVGVDEACGGIRSLHACILTGLFFGEWLRFSLARRAILLVAAIAAALAGNFVRVLFLSLRAAEGPDALAAAHDPAGWIAMAFSLVVTGCMACHWNGYRWPEQRPAPHPRDAQHAPAKLTLAWLAITPALLLANEAINHAWYRVADTPANVAPQWSAAFPEDHWSFRAAPLPDLARDMLRPDIYRAGSWRDENGVRASGYYIEWKRGQVARSIPFLHNPTVCLPAAGCELVETLEPIHVSSNAGEIPFLAYKFRQSGEEMLVAFTIWDSARARPLAASEELSSRAAWWRTQWSAVAHAREHQPAQLLTLALSWSENAPALAEQTLRQLISENSRLTSD